MRYYEVWGWDTFAGIDYFCGRYMTRKEAVEELLTQKKEAEETQDKEIRDTFSIVEVTDDEILKWEEAFRIYQGKMAEKSFNPEYLTQCVRELLELFKDALEHIDPEEPEKGGRGVHPLPRSRMPG